MARLHPDGKYLGGGDAGTDRVNASSGAPSRNIERLLATTQGFGQNYVRRGMENRKSAHLHATTQSFTAISLRRGMGERCGRV